MMSVGYIKAVARGFFLGFFLGSGWVLVWVGQITIKGIKALYWYLCLGYLGYWFWLGSWVGWAWYYLTFLSEGHSFGCWGSWVFSFGERGSFLFLGFFGFCFLPFLLSNRFQVLFCLVLLLGFV